jgi:hypothetical protein
MPIALARLIQTQAVDLAGEVSARLASGQRRITLGLGPGVDVPLLDEELHAAEVAMLDRELVVAAIRAESDGYVVERGATNFGVYVWSERDPIWESVPWMGAVRGLRPGDKLGLGSTPAEAVKLVFPDSPLVPPPARRTDRQLRAAAKAATPVGSAPAPPRSSTPASARRASPSRTWTGGPPHRYQHLFEVALRHWRYAMLTIGTDAKNTLVLDDPELAELRLAITRNPQHPDRGYELFVKAAACNPWLAREGGSVRPLDKGVVERLQGPGNRIGFGPYVIVLPEPVVPTPRFAPREVPSRAEIADVLGLSEIDLTDGEKVKARYRELARRFHPDRNSGDPGDTSRFLEIQTTFDAWRHSVR